MGYIDWVNLDKKTQEKWAARLRVELKVPKKKKGVKPLSLAQRLSAREDAVLDEFETLFKQYVPPTGPAAGREGHLLRAVMFASYRRFNDGDSLAEAIEMSPDRFKDAGKDADVWESFPQLMKRSPWPPRPDHDIRFLAPAIEMQQATVDRVRLIEKLGKLPKA